MIEESIDWILRLGDDHGVDPLVYAVIWVGSLPFFLLSLGWLVQRLRRRREFVLPLTVTSFFFLAPTLYVFVAGRDLPAWVYALLVGLAVVGAITTARRVRRRLRS
jgi:peptidoglycan/LPS O-acetylase OafA/YrhL